MAKDRRLVFARTRARSAAAPGRELHRRAGARRRGDGTLPPLPGAGPAAEAAGTRPRLPGASPYPSEGPLSLPRYRVKRVDTAGPISGRKYAMRCRLAVTSSPSERARGSSEYRVRQEAAAEPCRRATFSSRWRDSRSRGCASWSARAAGAHHRHAGGRGSAHHAPARRRRGVVSQPDSPARRVT